MDWKRAIVIGLSVCLGGWSGPGRAADQSFRVTLLGSGSPIPAADRFGPATLVEAGNHKFLFDAGRGATIRLYQLNIPMGKVDPLFLTHLHSDHTNGIPDLWLTGWLGGPFGRRTKPMHIIGPVGTTHLISTLQSAYSEDIRIRIADENYPPEGAEMVSEEFFHDGIVYDRDGVRVTAFEVNHGELIKPAYGYRVDYEGHSVVISGDTKFNENVIKYGTDADVLIHEVAAAPPALQNDPQVQKVMAHHTLPAEAGTVFKRAHPKLAVFTHIVLSERPNAPAITIPELVAQTRQNYDGPLEVGEDLMTIEAGDKPVVVRHNDAR